MTFGFGFRGVLVICWWWLIVLFSRGICIVRFVFVVLVLLISVFALCFLVVVVYCVLFVVVWFMVVGLGSC